MIPITETSENFIALRKLDFYNAVADLLDFVILFAFF